MSVPGIVVFGATGEIGRWLVVDLTASGERVAAVLRKPAARRGEFLSWIDRHGGDAGKIAVIEGDLTHDRLGIDDASYGTLADIRLVYNLGGRYAWGLTRVAAVAVNVDGAVRVVDFAAMLPRKPRVVHVSGYLVASGKRFAQLGLCRDVMPDWRQWSRLYRELGAYEASKMEGDVAVRAAAKRRGTALTIINPAAVIGHSESGEIAQTTGFAELVDQLWRGVMTAIPGTPKDWAPQVPVDYLAKFMARVPAQDTAPVAEYTVLCPDTPRFPDLIRMVAAHLGVPAPKRFIPVGVAKILLKAGLGKLTGTSGEPLSFLVPYDFDTASADAAATRIGLTRPQAAPVLEKTLDHIIATQFGEAPDGRGGFRSLAGITTFVDGNPAKASVVLLHGLPLTASSWEPLRAKLRHETLAADLPGQGRSQLVSPRDESEWLDALIAQTDKPIVLVAHSYACRTALRFAARHKQKVAALVLISPYFQHPRLQFLLRHPISAKPLLRLAGARRLKDLGQSAVHLRRPGALKRIAERLQLVGDKSDRAAHRRMLADVAAVAKTPILIVEGSHDRLAWPVAARIRRVIIAGGGHDPQITQPSDVADAIGAIAASDNLRAFANSLSPASPAR